MKLKEQGKVQKIISIILLIIWCGLIFYFSNQKGLVSEGSSNFIIDFLNNGLNLLNFNIDLYEVEHISFIIRKSAHMFLYFVLYLLFYYVMYQFKISKRWYITILFCFFYAVSDEVHQLFIPNRSCQITDILVDLMGSILASLIIKIKLKIKKLAN